MRKYILVFIISIPITLIVWNMGDSADEPNNTFNSVAEESDGKQTGILQETENENLNETVNALGMTLRNDTALLVKVRKYVFPTYNYVYKEYEYDSAGNMTKEITDPYTQWKKYEYRVIGAEEE